MASEYEHQESSAEQLETSLADEQVIVSVKQGVGSDGENPSDGSSDRKNVFDSDERVKIGAEVALASMSYDFRQLTMTKSHVTSLESFARYFLKGFARPPGRESILDPLENEVVMFEISLLLVSVYLHT
jgi:hypothetical protein